MTYRASEVDLPPLHSKQQMAFESPATEILYGGSTRAGKSFLVRWALINWCTQIKGLQCDIFRLNFDDVIGNHMEGESGFPVMLKNWVRDKLVTITQTEVRFNFNGSLISLEHCHDDKALLKHQGIPKHVRVFEEATQMRERHIRWLRGWVSMSEEMQSRVPDNLKVMWEGELISPFPRILYPTNPIGPSAGYFRRHFVKARPKMSIERAPESEGGFLRQYIPALVEDNPSEDAQKTRARIAGIGDEAMADALLNENWDAPIGEFFRQYDDDLHVVPTIELPKHWFKYRGFDWGGSDPFAVLWCAISDGEEFIYNNQAYWFPKGAKIIYREWYGAREDDQSKGLQMLNENIARGILERTPRSEYIDTTVTDSLPFQTRGGPTIASIFHDNGVTLTRADTERVAGWSHVRDHLIGKDGYPMLYIFDTCKFTREYIPALQRHKTKTEDAEESGEATHICDCLRMICMTFKIVKELPPQPKPIEIVQPTFNDVMKYAKRKNHGRKSY